MRLLYTFEDQKEALTFSLFLKSEGIENQCEIIANSDWGSSDYGTAKGSIWIIDEDHLDKAARWLENFRQNPNDPIFHRTEKPVPFGKPFSPTLEEAKANDQQRQPLWEENKSLGVITLYTLLLCSLLFLYSSLTAPNFVVPKNNVPAVALDMPPIDKALMYDYPRAFEIIDKIVKVYGVEVFQTPDLMPNEAQVLMQQYVHTPYWEGFYDIIENSMMHPNHPLAIEAPLFEKIRKGEIWRLFTPVLLHASIFHLFFNMIWLIVLGKLMEEKLGSVRYLAFVILTAIFSNTAQYLMGGSNFIGYSGVICAMLGFVWARQHIAAWEGYNLLPGVISFMLFFILAMTGLQITAFILKIYLNKDFFPAIANTAHLAGGIAGYILGRTNLFAMKV